MISQPDIVHVPTAPEYARIDRLNGCARLRLRQVGLHINIHCERNGEFHVSTDHHMAGIVQALKSSLFKR